MKGKNLLPLLFVLNIVAIGFVIALVITNSNQPNSLITQSNNQLNSANVSDPDGKPSEAEIINQVGKLILLPTGEKPEVATIGDVEKLKKQNPEIYKDAQAGDLLLLYKSRLIIYRQSENKLINVLPVVN